MRVGDLIEDVDYRDKAIILIEKNMSYIVYYMSGCTNGDIVEETKSKLEKHFWVISEGGKLSCP